VNYKRQNDHLQNDLAWRNRIGKRNEQKNNFARNMSNSPDKNSFSTPRRAAQIIFLILFGSMYIHWVIDHPRLNAGYIIGSAFGLTILSIAGALALVGTILLFTDQKLPDYGNKFLNLASALPFPLIVASAFFGFNHFKSVYIDAKEAKEFQEALERAYPDKRQR
jgi:hypothetical protein